ncbi:MAG: peptidoglycan DD-metalloendopeptidase family protein [Prevotellaceae bacterium]|jgi:murein DD-endopeptidase MepM/ murein hydrolase activator NlpD|nr:peptidoglycan DD-metalloendopeptidase family protein [Prevotellaceae bacterium]
MEKKKIGIIIFSAIILLLLGSISYITIKKNFFPLYYSKKDIVVIDSLIIQQPVLEYGIPVDSINIVSGTIKNGQLPATLLRSLGAPDNIINQLVLLPPDSFDLRKIKAGNTYKAFYTNDTLNTLSYFVYELSATDYAVFNLCDSLQIKLDKKQVNVVRKTGSATINSSLWNAVVNNGMNLLVTFELSDIYAWSIDFFGLKKGDSFDVIYDELYVDSTSIGIGHVHAAVFSYSGKSFYAFHFQNDSVNGYWDDKGENLKKTFLKAPLRFSRVSSGFTYARKHPILKTVRAHTGVDYAAPSGTPVMSIGQGTVIEKGYKGGGGNTVKIRHNSVYTTAYLHLSKYGKDIAVGSHVEQGQVIGYIGSTGLSTGPHLDFRVWKNNMPVNPLTMESPPAEPLSPQQKPVFDSIRIILQKELDEITDTNNNQ